MNTKILQLRHPTMIRQRLCLDDGFNACNIDVNSVCKITHILNCTLEITLPKQILVDNNHESIVHH